MRHKIFFAESGQKQAVKRLLVLAIGVLFISGAILSASFILRHAHHEHDHNGPEGGCATCAHLMVVDNLLKLLSAALVGAAIVAWYFPGARSILKPAGLQTCLFSLIHLKVRLNH
jgi:hypothetical protein